MITPRQLYEWCRIPYSELERHPGLKVPFRLVQDSAAMGELMARELVQAIRAAGSYRAILPCGPSCWYEPFAGLVNRERVSLRSLEVFHMDECLDWQGRELPRAHPYSFRGFMERHFYAPVDLTYGGWGQDGHVAYNQARRHPYSPVSLEELAGSTVRVQENNWDTVLSLAQRTFGAAWQFVPPLSVTLGLRECLSARKVRLFSDTGSWKQTALRVALFSEPDPEYPITLLSRHPDALLTATLETAAHPISLHPEWDLGL